jgi:hypothetical protein
MDLIKCHKFLRDCKLLDNRIGFDEADRVFNQYKDKEDRINHGVFLSFVQGFAEKKYPTFPPELALKMVYQVITLYNCQQIAAIITLTITGLIIVPQRRLAVYFDARAPKDAPKDRLFHDRL